VLAGVAFGGLELTFLAANMTKVIHGGWVPLLIAAGVCTVMTTWRRGRQLLIASRKDAEGSLSDFVEDLRTQDVPRVAGMAVFPHPNKDTTPLALRANVEHNHVLHRAVVIVSFDTENVPHVPRSEAFHCDDLGYSDDGITHLSVRFGFSDRPDMPRALHDACAADVLDASPDEVDAASYFLSRGPVRRTSGAGMSRWRKQLFLVLAHNAADPAAQFALPPGRTVTMGSDINI
jgi:KUP system potassium uptake protein